MGLSYVALERTVVKLAGEDRKKFLHNFCTADINAMADGDVREAFILNTKGKIIGLVTVVCFPEFIELNTVAAQASALIEHLDRYLIREDVELIDESERRQHIFVFDSTDSDRPQSGKANLEPATGIQTIECEIAGWGKLLSHEQLADLEDHMASMEIPESDLDQLHVARLNAGTPWFGLDCTENNLPQEMQRDEKAISFTKGCYLGQETVARIDALGQVNKLLVRVNVNGSIPESGEIVADGKAVGKITSVATKSDGQKIGLAVVRRAFSKSGTIINDAEFELTVI